MGDIDFPFEIKPPFMGANYFGLGCTDDRTGSRTRKVYLGAIIQTVLLTISITLLHHGGVFHGNW